MEGPPPTGAGPESTGTENESHEAQREERPRIYVASLSDYNEGILHGAWIDADQELGALYEAVDAMLDSSPSERRACESAGSNVTGTLSPA